jgi:hypothetical protein
VPFSVSCTAPASHAAPFALATPRWSVTGHTVTGEPPTEIVVLYGMALIAGLWASESSAKVCVGPPLLLSGARSFARFDPALSLSPTAGLALKHVESVAML